MENVYDVMRNYRSFNAFKKSKKFKKLTNQQLQLWHKQLQETPPTGEREKRFRNCFYRTFAERLGLKVEEWVDDKRTPTQQLIHPSIFWTVMRTMRAAGIFRVRRNRLVESVVGCFSMSHCVRSVVAHFSTIYPVDEELLALLRRRMEEKKRKKNNKKM